MIDKHGAGRKIRKAETTKTSGIRQGSTRFEICTARLLSLDLVKNFLIRPILPFGNIHSIPCNLVFHLTEEHIVKRLS